MRFRRVAAAALCAAALTPVACGVNEPSGNTTETFNGVLQPGGANAFGFSVGKTGEVTVTITAMSPTTNVALGVLIGQFAGSSCQSLGYVNNFSLLNRTAVTA